MQGWVGGLLGPILLLVAGGAGWAIRRWVERRQELEEKLRQDRIGIYIKILEPFIIGLMTDAAWNADPKNKGKNKQQVLAQKMLSLEYRELCCRFTLMGSDETVRAANDLWQYFFQQPDLSQKGEVRKMSGLLGELLRRIRISIGNEATALDRWEMLEWFLTDARKYRDSR